MTNGSPTSSCRGERAQTRAQADRIRELLVGGMDMPPSAARVKRALRRAQDVAPSDPARQCRPSEETAR